MDPDKRKGFGRRGKGVEADSANKLDGQGKLFSHKQYPKRHTSAEWIHKKIDISEGEVESRT